MHKTTATVFTLAALAGCAHEGTPEPAIGSDDQPPAFEHGEHSEDIGDNLRALADLEVFEVGELVVQQPDSAFACYGPCPGYEDDLAQAETEAQERLAAFTAAALAAASEPSVGDPGPSAVDELLAELDELAVVEVEGLVERQLDSAGSCYVGFCPEEIEQRAALASIVEATRGI